RLRRSGYTAGGRRRGAREGSGLQWRWGAALVEEGTRAAAETERRLELACRWRCSRWSAMADGGSNLGED
ncbi:hypothetical protein Dimus_016418, partial [Dionaea muscipula]